MCCQSGMTKSIRRDPRIGSPRAPARHLRLHPHRRIPPHRHRGRRRSQGRLPALARPQQVANAPRAIPSGLTETAKPTLALAAAGACLGCPEIRLRFTIAGRSGPPRLGAKTTFTVTPSYVVTELGHLKAALTDFGSRRMASFRFCNPFIHVSLACPAHGAGQEGHGVLRIRRRASSKWPRPFVISLSDQ